MPEFDLEKYMLKPTCQYLSAELTKCNIPCIFHLGFLDEKVQLNYACNPDHVGAFMCIIHMQHLLPNLLLSMGFKIWRLEISLSTPESTY